MSVNPPKQRDKQPLDCYPLPSNTNIKVASLSIIGLIGSAVSGSGTLSRVLSKDKREKILKDDGERETFSRGRLR
jgi:hypothetical protein